MAGSSTQGFSGDGGPAAQLFFPAAVVFDASGNLLIADSDNGRIRRVDLGTGIITTVAGGGSGYGDGGPATSAQILESTDVAVDVAGNLFISDRFRHIIRRVDAITGIITTVAGTQGVAGFSGDNSLATDATINQPFGVAVDSLGNLYISDLNNRIRKVDSASQIITTVAGTGTAGFNGDGILATSAQIGPIDIEVDAVGNLYIVDTGNHRIRRVDAGTGFITTVAGNGAGNFSGDGGSATDAGIKNPNGVAFDASGNMFIADASNARIRRVDGVTGIITTVAGNGTAGFSGDGGPATDAGIKLPRGVAVDAAGALFIADTNNNRIRKVN